MVRCIAEVGVDNKFLVYLESPKIYAQNFFISRSTPGFSPINVTLITVMVIRWSASKEKNMVITLFAYRYERSVYAGGPIHSLHLT